MKQLLSITICVAIIFCFTWGLAQAQTPVVVQNTPQVILLYGEGQAPTIAKVPSFAYCGMQPLSKSDKVLDAVMYKTNNKHVYEDLIKFYRKAYRSKNWDPKKMRMMVIQTAQNKSFSMSGNVSASFSNTVSDTASLTQNIAPLSSQATKSGSDTLSSSGGVFPSYSKSWQDTRYEVWFFEIQ